MNNLDQSFFKDKKPEDKKEEKKEEKEDKKEEKTALKSIKKATKEDKNNAAGKRFVKSISGQRVLGFKRRSVVFPQNVSVEITEAEYKSRDYQSNKDYFREVQ